VSFRPLSLALQPVAPAAWDRLLHASGLVALTGILLTVCLSGPGELAVLFALAVLTNGPYSMFLPVGFEPVLMVFGRLYPAVLVAAVATGGIVAVEYVNYRIYDAALHSRLMAEMREAFVVRLLVRWFGRQPFFTVLLCALAPVPFWVVRVAGVLDGYPVRRFLAAAALGRFPLFLAYAALGSIIPVTSGAMLAAGAAATLVLGATVAIRRDGRDAR